MNVANGPAPRWQIRVDWADNDHWGAENADLSGDVLALRWQAGRRGLPIPEFAPPATLELTLRNPSHRYTPGNTGGPLGDSVRPGRPIRLRASRIYDDFAPGSAAPTDLHRRPTGDGTARWTVTAPAHNGFTVQDGTVQGLPGWGRPADAVALLDTGDPKATIAARYRRASNGNGGFALRCAAPTNCLRLRFTNSASRLERVNGRRSALLAEGPALDAATWYDLEIEQADGGVRVYAVNLTAAGVPRRKLLTADRSRVAGAPASGRHGLWRAYRNANDRWGDFSVGRSLFSGRITGIRPDHAAGNCRLTAADALRPLATTRLYRALAGGPLHSGSVAAAILGWTGRHSTDYDLDPGRLLLTGGPRAVWDLPALTALRRVQREEHGLIYTDGLGRIRLEAASVRSALRRRANPAAPARFAIAAASNAPASSGGATDTPYAAALLWNDGAAAVEKRVSFRYRRPVDAGRQPVWNLSEPLAIAPQSELRILATAGSWDVIRDVANPVAGSDYAATTAADGAGTDATAWLTITPLSATRSGVSGRGVMLRVHNSGAQTAYLHRLRLYAAHGWQLGDSAAHRAAAPDAGSDTPEAAVNCHYADHYAAARGAAAARLAERSRQRPQLAVTLPLSAAANLRAATEGRLSEVVAVTAAPQGISGAWLLEGMTLTAPAGEPAQAQWWLTGV